MNATGFPKQFEVWVRPGRWIAYWPILPPILVTIIYLTALHFVAFSNRHVDVEPAALVARGFIGPGAAAASLWLASTAALLVSACVGASVLAVLIIIERRGCKQLMISVACAAGGLIFVALVSVVLRGVVPIDSFIDTPGYCSTVGMTWLPPTGWIWKTIASIEKVIFASAGSCDWGDLTKFRFVTGVGILPAAMVIILAALAIETLNSETMSVESHASDSKHTEDRKNLLNETSDSMNRLKGLLYAASIVLVCGVLFVKAWTELPLGIASDSGLQANEAANAFAKNFSSLAEAFQLFQALWYVSLMASLFLPVSLTLDRRATALALMDGDVANGTTTVEEWRAARNLSLSFSAQFQRLAAFLAPLFAAPVADALKALTMAVVH